MTLVSSVGDIMGPYVGVVFHLSPTPSTAAEHPSSLVRFLRLLLSGIYKTVWFLNSLSLPLLLRFIFVSLKPSRRGPGLCRVVAALLLAQTLVMPTQALCQALASQPPQGSLAQSDAILADYGIAAPSQSITPTSRNLGQAFSSGPCCKNQGEYTTFYPNDGCCDRLYAIFGPLVECSNMLVESSVKFYILLVFMVIVLLGLVSVSISLLGTPLAMSWSYKNVVGWTAGGVATIPLAIIAMFSSMYRTRLSRDRAANSYANGYEVASRYKVSNASEVPIVSEGSH
eukprot:GHVS01072252.1.p1 GENE.GHVS01072252.1~~GHVS01072252.1.p1  ORF type:complete len:285 (+),score=23.91 GHVS01072252.1:138-992(+)